MAPPGASATPAQEFTFTCMLPSPMHPFASVAASVIVWGVVRFEENEMLAETVPLLHVYVLAPDAVIVCLFPLQITVLAMDTERVGSWFNVMVTILLRWQVTPEECVTSAVTV